MDPFYFNFLAADRLFYDIPDASLPRSRSYHASAHFDWSGWARYETPGWRGFRTGADLPQQGWKIHVSATPANAPRLLEAVSRYAGNHAVDFKFVPSEAELIERNGKQAHRGFSGKFITLYPRDLLALRVTLEDLEALIGGEDGPYILSDLRWKNGPLYVRYGAFQTVTMLDQDDAVVSALLAPDGTPVPDRRDAVFTPPEWVSLPPFIAEQLAAQGDGSAPEGFDYRIIEALHFSNTGGIYRGEAADGAHVVLKESRPHTAPTLDRQDAITRSRSEERFLRELADEPEIVHLRDAVELGGHRFLVMDELEGPSLRQAMVQRSPAVRSDATQNDYLDYRDWALGVTGELDRIVRRLHERGIVHGDLQPANVILTGQDQPVLIDFEAARAVADEAPSSLATPGFAAPRDRVGVEADLYSLACLKLYLFLPITALLALDPRKAQELIAAAERMFQLPLGFTDSIRKQLLPTTLPALGTLAKSADAAVREWDTFGEDKLELLTTLISQSIEASADYSRTDRCFPGDPQQFAEGAIGLAHGAAGVIHAIDAAGLDVDPRALAWLDGALDAPRTPHRIGFYDGLAGVAWLKTRLGDQSGAQRVSAEVLDRTRRALADPASESLSSGLYGGLAGIGLYLLERPDDEALATAERIAHELRARLQAQSSSLTRRGGLMWGPSGVALFATRLYERTRQAEHLDLATDAIRLDRDRLTPAADGSLQMDEGRRLMPYLATGSAGVALVIAQLLPHLDAPEPYLDDLDGIEGALASRFAIQSGLFSGRAGLIHVLAVLSRLGLASSEGEGALTAHVDALQLHAIRHKLGVAFPGDGLLRLSSDLATGSAGVLGAIQAYTLLTYDGDYPDWRAIIPLILPTQDAPLSSLRLTQ